MDLETIKLLKSAGYSAADIVSAMTTAQAATPPAAQAAQAAPPPAAQAAQAAQAAPPPAAQAAQAAQTAPPPAAQAAQAAQTAPPPAAQAAQAAQTAPPPANDVSNRDILAELSKLTNMIAVSNIQGTMTNTPPAGINSVHDAISQIAFGAPPAENK